MPHYPLKRFAVKTALRETLELKVLIADDDAMIRTLLPRIIEQHLGEKHPGVTIQILTAENGEKAKARIDEHGPHAVFTDYRMPKVSGDGVIAHARAKGVHFIVGLSAANQQQMASALRSHREAGGNRPVHRKTGCGQTGPGCG